MPDYWAAKGQVKPWRSLARLTTVYPSLATPPGGLVHRSSLAGLGLLLIVALPAAAQTKLLRFPAINADKVAFTYAGDIWTAPATGGTATRITAHPGMEVFPHFSPDGKWIAFTGQYDGDEQGYVGPATGGVPRSEERRV